MSDPVKQAWFSILEYRRDVASEDGALRLGVALEVQTPSKWFAGIYVRSFLTPEELAPLDPIARDLLANPLDFFRGQMQAVLPLARKPSDVLRHLHDRHNLTIYATVPSLVPEAIAKTRPASGSEAMLNSLYEMWLMEADLEEASQRAPRRIAASAKRRKPKPVSSQLEFPIHGPPPWGARYEVEIPLRHAVR